MDALGQFLFGCGGNALSALGAGWARPEEGFCWTNAVHSLVRLPAPQGEGAVGLEIFLTPFRAAPVLMAQRVRISVNGAPVADEVIRAETMIGVEIASYLAASAALEIVLDCPDATVPAALGLAGVTESRRLGVAVCAMRVFRTPAKPVFGTRLLAPLQECGINLPEAVQLSAGMSIEALTFQFQSLGHDCEFGLVQRQMGSEPLGLLRFAGTHPHNLIRGLEQEFAGVELAENLTVYTEPGRLGQEYRARDILYGVRFHTERTDAQISQSDVLALLQRRNSLLRRKFLEDLAGGEKLFVYRYPPADSVAQIRPILTRLRRYGASLLFVSEGQDQPAGSVAHIEPDLFWGWAPSLKHDNGAPRPDPAAWISVCANAYRLWRGMAT